MIEIFNVLFVLVLNSSRIFIVVFDLVVVFPSLSIKVNVTTLRIESQVNYTIVALT